MREIVSLIEARLQILTFFLFLRYLENMILYSCKFDLKFKIKVIIITHKFIIIGLVCYTTNNLGRMTLYKEITH